MPRRSALMTLGLATLMAAMALTGCSSSDAPVKEPNPTALLATAKQKLDETTGVTFTLGSAGVPGKVNGVSGAKGIGVVNPMPAFQGTVNATVQGITGTVEVVAVDKDFYMKFFTPTFNKVDPGVFGAPNPAQLFNKATGISTLMPVTTGARNGPKSREGSEVLLTVQGKVPGTKIADLFVFGDKAGTFNVTYGIDEESGQLRKAVMTGPFFSGATSTYTLLLKDYGQTTTITRP